MIACRIAIICVAALFTLGADTSRARFEKLGHAMVCTCGCNQILLECNHVGCPSSDKMRNELVAGMQQGDDDAVFKSFVAKYGPTVLAAPTAIGFNLSAWITPFVVFAAGLAIAVLVVRNWRFRPHSTAVSSPSLDPYVERARRETEL